MIENAGARAIATPSAAVAADSVFVPGLIEVARDLLGAGAHGAAAFTTGDLNALMRRD